MAILSIVTIVIISIVILAAFAAVGVIKDKKAEVDYNALNAAINEEKKAKHKYLASLFVINNSLMFGKVGNNKTVGSFTIASEKDCNDIMKNILLNANNVFVDATYSSIEKDLIVSVTISYN